MSLALLTLAAGTAVAVLLSVPAGLFVMFGAAALAWLPCGDDE